MERERVRMREDRKIDEGDKVYMQIVKVRLKGESERVIVRGEERGYM